MTAVSAVVVTDSTKLSKKHKHAQVLDTAAAAPLDISKQSKKRKRPAESEAAVNVPLPAVPEDDDAARKERKRAKKAAKLQAEEAGRAAIGGRAVVNSGGDADAEEEKERAKREKKARKEEKRAAKRVLEATSTDGALPVEPERPKKKPKHTVNSGSTTVVATPAHSTPTPDEIATYLSTNAISLHPPSPTLAPILSFSNLPLAPVLLSAPLLSKFATPTPIQACCWPVLLSGRDIVGVAETGSGKTLAFGLPALQHILSLPADSHPGPKVLVVAPTRELALQTYETLLELGKPLGVGCACLFGGVGKDEQRAALSGSGGGKKGKGTKGARVVVGTPGRVLDLIEEGVCDVSRVTYLVLDEADRMLDKGFEADITKIIGMCAPGPSRQTAMFSATWPDSVRRLAGTFMRDPVRVTVGSEDLTANRRVEQVVEVLDNSWSKDDRLKSLLKSINAQKAGNRTLVFVLYKKEATRVHTLLQRSGYKVGAIHGDLGQAARMQALDEFKAGKTGVLVATDVAARGLDIPSVQVVVNYSFPLTIEDYVHRIGRTGRGGHSGKSVTFFTGEGHEKALAGELMRVVRDAGCEVPKEMGRFPSTIKKKEHAVYGAFYKEMGPEDAKPKKIVFD